MEILISKVVVFAIIVESQQVGMLKVFDDDDVAFLLLKAAFDSKNVSCSKSVVKTILYSTMCLFGIY